METSAPGAQLSRYAFSIQRFTAFDGSLFKDGFEALSAGG
jgi:hypothetical protein